MTATTFIQEENIPIEATQKISWEEFQSKYLTREDNYKYEWIGGKVERTLRFELKEGLQKTPETKQETMHESQFFILNNLLNFFIELKIKHKIKGQLIAEGDTFFVGNHRRPDIAFYTFKQIQEAREGKMKVPPQFIIEVISKNDQAIAVHEKMKNYRKAKVPVIWHIYPNLKQVHVYQGKKMEIKEGNDLCSAESIIQDFVISVKDIFK